MFHGVFLMICYSRLFIAGVSLVQVAALGVAFIHWAIWPLMSRLVYAVERYEVLKTRRFFGTMGAGLLIHASAGTQWIAGILEALGLSK